jgi:ketosteroid isomerase-like protein
MAEESVEVVRGHIEAYRNDDVEVALGFFDRDIVMDTTRSRGVGGEVAHGYDHVVREVRSWMGTFEDYEFEVQRITDLGAGAVLVVATERGRGKGSGAAVERTMAGLYFVLAGKIVRITGYPTEQAALEAVGHRE